MKDLGVVRYSGMNTSQYLRMVSLKHTKLISSGMRKYFLIIIAYITRRMMIHQKKFKKYL